MEKIRGLVIIFEQIKGAIYLSTIILQKATTSWNQ